MPPKKRTNVNRANKVQAQQLVALKDIQLHTRSTQRSIYYRPDPPKTMIKDRKVYPFRRSYELAILQAAGLADNLGAYNFQISSVPAYTEFTQLFDQYMISEVSVRFLPAFAVTTNLYTVIDYDDSTTPAALTDLDQYQSLVLSESGTMVERTLHPKVAVSVYQGAVPFTGYAAGRTWIDSASNSVQHYGVKWCIPATSATSGTKIYSVSVSLLILCRFPH